MQIKTADPVLEIKALNDKGEIEGYGSTFGGEPDSYGDVIAPGAYADSLAAHKSKGTMPKMLWQHDPHEVIGRWTEAAEDVKGLILRGNPQGTISPTIWGLPVVTTQAIAEDKFLAGAFKLGAQVFDRWDARVEVGYVNDDFTKNLVTILAEERLALAVYRPEAFVFGDFGNVA